MTVTFSQLGKYGRFGNQLFQIASTIGIAKRNHQDFIFPEWEYSKYFKNKLPTGNINIDYNIQEISPYYHEYAYEFYPDKNYNLSGYFQSYKYFDEYKDLIKHYFTLNEHENVLIDSISLHVRRGDYLNLDNHPVLSLDYYETAIDILPSDKEVVVFSDDIQWCKENLLNLVHTSRRILFSTNNDEVLDFQAMKHCKYNIIANSSFSWWAAYLNLNPDKIVIAPSIYVNNETHTEDRYPSGWIVI